MTDLLVLLKETRDFLWNGDFVYPTALRLRLEAAIAELESRQSELQRRSRIGWCGDRSGTPFGPSDAGPEEEQSALGEDMLDACKASVLKAAFGLKSLSEAELLRRLEDLYLEGLSAGVKAFQAQVE